MRLTRKDKCGSYWHDDIEVDIENETYTEREVLTPVGTKLGQLEDIEEELGIDLITFFKIYNTYHFYIKGKEYQFKIRHYQKHGIMVGTNKPRYLPFKDYGKTWALTMEELL